MLSIHHIAVPYDGEKSAKVALETACSLAKMTDGKVTAIYVKRTDGDEKAEELKREVALKSEEIGRDILFLHPTGKMYKEVARSVAEVGADLIMMGTHGSSGFEEFWIGSNAFRVVSSSPVPVITMQETHGNSGFKRILAPIDNSKETRQKIPMISRMARFFNADVHLFGTSKYDSDDSQRKVTTYLEQSVKMLGEDEVPCEYSTEFGGNVAQNTLDKAMEIGADLVVMMSESEPSAGFFMGSNAQQVINHSKIPVLTLHPKDVGIATLGY